MDKETEEIRKKKMEELVRKLNDPKTKAKEFAKAIVECEEYRNHIQYNEQLRKGQTAQYLLREFQQKQISCNGTDLIQKHLKN